MRLISFDVGIKNLAYCVFASDSTSQPKTWSISEWNCTNLIAKDLPETMTKTCCHSIKGKRKDDMPHPCGKIAKWSTPNDNAISYCELHSKTHTEWIIPKKRHSSSHINKMKLAELESEYATICKNNRTDEKTQCKMKKSELIEKINAYYELNCFKSTTANITRAKTAGEVDLVTIGRAIKRQLDEDPSTAGITHVIIENQISTLASRMKTIQGMIAQYFIMRFGDSVHIEFVSSHNKLKGFAISQHHNNHPDATDDKKRSYKANKSDGIAICREFINMNTEMNGWLTEFEKSKKRDDLADCFLQGIWYLKSNKIISYADNLKINIVLVS